MQRYCKTDSDVIQTSNEIRELTAKKLKPHIEEFVKECIVTAAKMLAPDKDTLFKKVSLCRRTISDRIKEMGEHIDETLKNRAKAFEFFALALDETTDISNKPQLAIFI